MTAKTQKTGAKQAEKAMAAGTEAVEKALEAGKETFEKAVEAGADTFNETYDKAVAATKEQVQRFFPAAVTNFDEAARFSKGTFDVWLAAGTVAARAFESIGHEIMAYNQKAIEAGLANTKALMGAKTLQEAVELQTEIARANFDEFVAEGTKLSEMSVKATSEAMEPLNARFTEAVEKFVKPLAA